MRAPGRGIQQLVGLRHDQGPDLGREGHEVIVLEQVGPMIAAVAIIIELPQMHQLVQRPRVGGKITHQLGVEAALFQRRPTEFEAALFQRR